LLAGLTFSVSDAMEIRVPSHAASVAVPLPPLAKLPPVPLSPTVALPTAHMHNGKLVGLSCKKLDTCLAVHAAEADKLKTCVMASLSKEKGEKVWTAFTKAKLESESLNVKKKKLALLKSSSSSLFFSVLSRAALQALFSQSSTVLADICLADEPKIPKHLRSPVHVPVPKAATVGLPKPPGGHPGTALAKSAAPSKKALEPVQPVKVPEATKVNVPTPHGHPDAAEKDKKTKREKPAACQQLSLCIDKVDKKQYSVGFKKCMASFCQKMHGDKKFEGKDDPRSALCDQKGKDALDTIAKATAEGDKKKPSLIAFGVVKAACLLA